MSIFKPQYSYKIYSYIIYIKKECSGMVLKKYSVLK